MKRIVALILMLCMLCPSALAANTTPTPPPVEIEQEVLTPPPLIQDVLNIAYNEWETIGGARLKNPNKFTEWRGKGVKFGWCAGYITWCMLEAGVPQERMDDVTKAFKQTNETYYNVDGVFHIKEANVGKLLQTYLLMNRTTNVPQPGFLQVYGCSYNKYIHVGLVYDVQPLGNGKFRITTLEGNMNNTVKMFIHDYDMYAEDHEKNLSPVPESERLIEASSSVDYAVISGTPNGGSEGKKYQWYVNCFLMPWVPGDEVNEATTPTPPAQ